MEIRRARAEDIEEIIKINNSEAKWVGLKQKDFFIQYLDISRFDVASEDSSICGFMMVMDESADYRSDYYLWFKSHLPFFNYIDRVIVRPDVRRKGIATRFYEPLIADVKPLVCEVSIIPENTESIIFHKNLNFQSLGLVSKGGKTCAMYYLDRS